MLKNLGDHIRTIRKEKGVTLVELAKRTGVAQATLSRIETGTMIGTVESHDKIAEALGIGLADLYAPIDKRYDEIIHQKADAERKVTRQGTQARFELLTQENSKKKITPLLLTLQAHSETQNESNERGVEKFIFVLKGQLVVKVDDQEYPLSEEETLYFDASLKHKFLNKASGMAKALIAVSPSKI